MSAAIPRGNAKSKACPPRAEKPSQRSQLNRSLLLTSQMTSQYTSLYQRCTVASWQLQDAKARFTEFLNATLEKGPQIVTRRGIEAAVLVPIEQWNRLQTDAQPSLRALLLAPEGRTENLTVTMRSGATRASETRTLRRRAVLKF